MTNKPTPKEIDDLVYELRQAGKDDTYSIARAVLAKWGSPVVAGEPTVKYVPVDSNLKDKHWNHPNDDEPRTEACRQALRDRGDDRGQGLDGYWKWGFAAGFNAALDTTPQPTQAQAGAVTDAQVLAAVRVVSPGLFRHGLQPLPNDGANTAAQMRKEADTVRKMLEAAFSAAQPVAREPLTDAMVSRAGRALSDVYATECGVDKEDNWKIYGSDFIETARLVLEAAHDIKGGQHGTE